MASGQMNFNMRFTADTSQAQSSIQQLQTSLSQIAMAGSGTGISKGMSEAAGAAKELSYHLNQAYNATTGNFDLSRLDKSLKTSKTNVSELSSKLLQAGQSGQQAFVQLAQSIAAADRPMVTLSSRMKDFATTMKNTAKWQISSSVLHGFMGAVQQAYGYAQDLNESLNNIRIVTGYNTDQMAAFAEKANKAAKALSTTTTAYTDAALIYYQQGLGDKEIEERTAVTVKMANVSGQAAETVSDQMTAVWNNFYDGSKSLEYYADVMTKLGAATASSSDEIAQGLEKFAAVSESVGLSYEYATAALATVTAETRQSADVVGTAFKTMFARIQGLKLGETLEDGTNLNQYSEALLAVGVNIKDANGELKDMDAILNEMAAVWETLNRDEQVALAQKVAGVRQYNQLMSLMNNWDVMEQNLEFVEMSEGSLQEQQDIYEESWKAASDRVRASMESIYSDLIDDEFFIDLTNGFSSLIDSLDAFIDGFGGVKMIVMSVASILMSTFAHKIPGALENLKANFNVVFKGASAQAQALTQDFNNVINAKLQDPNLNFNKSQEVALTNAKLLNEAKSKMLVIQDKMKDSEKQLAETELSIIGALEQETQQLADQITKRQQEIALLKEEMSYESADDEVYKAYGDQESALAERYAAARQGSPLQQGDTVAKTNEALQKQRALINQVADARKEYISILAAGYEQEMAATNGQIEKSTQVLSLYDLMGDKVDEYVKALKKMKHGTGDVEQQKAPFREIAKQISLITGDSCPKLTEAINKALDAENAEDFKAAIVGVSDALKKGQIEGKNFGKILKQFGQGTYVDKMNKSYKNLNQTTKDLIAKQDALNQKIKQFNPTHVVTGLEKITAVAGGLGQVAMLATSVRSIFQAWSNDDLSFGEKLTTTFMSLSMIVPAAIGAFKSFNGVLGITSAIQEVLTMSTLKKMEADSASLAVMSAEEIAKTKNIALDTAKLTLTQAIISTTMAKIGAEEGLTAAQAAETIATMAGMSAEKAKLIVDKVSNGMTIAQAMAEAGLTGAKSSGVIATIAQTVAQWALNAAMSPTLALTLGIAAALGTLLVGFAGIVAVIGLVVAGFKAFNDYLNADSIAAKEASQHADLLAEKYNKLAEEANKFKESVSNYDTAVESLKKLEKGTDEYKEALEKANEEALKLIELYGLWDKVKGYDKNGLIVFEDNSLQGVQQEKTSAANDAKWEADAAKIGSLYKDITKTTGEVAKTLGAIVADGEIKGKQNTTRTKYRQLNNDEMGEIAGVFAQAHNLQSMSDEALTSFLENSTSLSSHLKGLIPNIVKNRDAFENLSKVLNTSASELDFKTKGLISNTIDKQFSSQIDEMSIDSTTGKVDEGRRSQILNAAATGLYHAEMNKENGLANQLSEINVKKVSTTGELQEYEQYKDVGNDEELARKYAEVILGMTEDEANKLQYVKGTGEGALKDEEGNEVLKTTDDVYMRQRLAQHAEEQQVKENYETSDADFRQDYMSAFEGLIEGGDALGAELGANVTGALLESLQMGVGELDLTSMFGGLNADEVASLTGLDANALVEKLGVTPEQLKTLGFDSATAFKEAFDESLNQWTPELAKENFLNDLTSKTTEDASSFGLDPGLLQDVAEGFAEMAEAGAEGYEGLNENAELAADAATRYVRLQEAVLDLSENYDDYEEVLTGVRKASNKVDKSFAMNSENGVKLKRSLAGLLGTTEDLIDADLVEAIDPKDFEAAAKGDQAAIERIRDEFIKLQAEANGIDFEGLKGELAGLKEGASIDLDIDSFLSNLITAKLNAGATATDIENMLQGFGIDMDNITFYDSLAEAQAAAAETGGIIADELSYTEETETEATEIQKNGSEGDFTEDISSEAITEINKVTETDAEGNITERDIPSTIYKFTKTVSEGSVPTQETETVTNTEKKVTTGSGQEGSAPPKKAAVITGKKSVGNRVSPGTSNTAKNNNPGGKTGGKTSSPAEKVKKTKKSDVVDRYKEVTDALDDNTRALDKATKKADALYGPARIKWLKEANKLIGQQNTLLQKQINQAKTNLTDDKNALQKAGEEAGLGKNAFVFDANGNVTNYTTQLEKLFNELHQAEVTMGNLATKEDQDEYKEKYLQPIQDKIDLLKEYLEQYEETRELIEDLEDQMEDNLRQIENNKSAQISHVIELKIEVNDEQLKQLEFLLKRLEARGSFGAAQSVATMQQQLPIYQAQASVAEEGLERYLNEWLTPAEKKLFYAGKSDQIDWTSKENLPDDFFEKIFGYVDSYQEATENAIQLKSEVYDALNQAFSDLTSEIDRSIDMFDKYNSVMDHYTNIIDLSGMKSAFTTEELQQFNQEKVNNANNKVESSLARKNSADIYAEDRRIEYEKDVALREDILKKLETAKGAEKEELELELEQIESTIAQSKQAWQDAEDYAIEANEEYLSAWEDALQISRDVFLANAQLEIDELEKQMAGAYGSIEAMQEEFDKNQEINDRYLDDYERIYELTKLTRDLNKKMDETSNIKAKKELAKLQEQILFYQEEGRKMSDYDLEYLQKRYDLKLAEIAMEEAQNAKSEVRLTRDNEGNYSYTYVADENQLAESQQSYEDKLFAITDLSNEHIKEQSQLLIQTQQEYADALAEIAQKAYEGQYETAEEHQKAIEECTAYYVGKMNYHGAEVDRAIQNNAIVYMDDYETYEVYVGRKLTESERLQKEMDADILESEALTQKLQQEKQAARDEVHLQYARGLIKDTETYENELKKIDEKYDTRIAEADKKTKTMITERNGLYGADAGNYDAARIKKEASDKGFITSLKTTFLPQLDDAQATGAGFVKRTTDAIGDPKKGTGYLGQASKSFQQLETNIANNMKAAGVALDENGKVKVDEFKKKVKNDLVDGKDSVSNKSKATKEAILKLTDSLSNKKTGLTATAAGVHSWAASIGKDVSGLITKFNNLSKAALSAKDAVAKQAEAELDDKKCKKCKKDPCECKPDNGEGNTGDQNGNGTPEVGDMVTYDSGYYYYDSMGTKPLGNRGVGKKKKAKITRIVPGAAYPIHLYSTDNAYGWVKKEQISGYDTGGYTGSWGPEGRLAMLHEKELVLNKQDTENMLRIISMVRDLSTILDLQAHQASLAQLQINQIPQLNQNTESLEQLVTIHAEFPGAVYASEIETALNNLVNSASQYANRKY